MPTIQRIFDIIDDLYELLTETKNRGHLNLTLHNVDKRQLEDLITLLGIRILNLIMQN